MEEGLLTKIFRFEAEFNSWTVAEEFISVVLFWISLPFIFKLYKYLKGKS